MFGRKRARERDGKTGTARKQENKKREANVKWRRRDMRKRITGEIENDEEKEGERERDFERAKYTKSERERGREKLTEKQ